MKYKIGEFDICRDAVLRERGAGGAGAANTEKGGGVYSCVDLQ